jgi:hypothetical protein
MPALHARRQDLPAPLSPPSLASSLCPDPPLLLPRQPGAPADTAPGKPVARPDGAHQHIAGPPGAGTAGHAAAPPDRQRCHPVSSVRGRTPGRHRGAAFAGGIRPSPSPSAEPMTPLASHSAPSAISPTLVLCLSLRARARRVVPTLFIVAPPSPRHGRRRRLPPISPGTGALPPLLSVDHSHSRRPRQPAAGSFVQRAFFAHRAVARRHEKALFRLRHPPPQEPLPQRRTARAACRLPFVICRKGPRPRTKGRPESSLAPGCSPDC